MQETGADWSVLWVSGVMFMVLGIPEADLKWGCPFDIGEALAYSST